MRLLLINIVNILLLFAAAGCRPNDGDDRQMLVGGRVATYGSVLASVGGDTAAVARIARPLPVESPYLTRQHRHAERIWNAYGFRYVPLAATLVALLLTLTAGGRVRRLAGVGLAIILIADFALRWELLDGIPLTTGGDTLAAIAMFASAGLCFVGERRYAAGLLAAITVLLVGALVMNGHPAVRPVNLALQSPWLPIHVGLMMLAYSCFLAAAVAAAISTVGRRTFMAIVVGEAALVAGIVVGALWAAEAWGRYWGWDPKETWALATSLIYLIIIACWLPTARRPRLRRLLVGVGFLAVVATWWGVNYLGGLHSY